MSLFFMLIHSVINILLIVNFSFQFYLLVYHYYLNDNILLQQEISKYSNWFLEFCGLKDLTSSSDYQFLFHAFWDRTKDTNNNQYHCDFHSLQLFSSLTRLRYFSVFMLSFIPTRFFLGT